MKISVNQLLPIANGPETNYKTLVETLEKNAQADAKLSIFPENYLYGVLRSREYLIHAGKQFDKWVEKFQKLAQKYHVDLVPGTFPRYQDGNVYNSTVYISSSGEILTRYSKCNLWLSERDEYESSLEVPMVFDGVLGKTAVIICWDILDHKLIRSAVKHGAEWIICLAFWSVNQSEDLMRKRGTTHKEFRKYSDSRFLSDLIPTRSVEYGIGMIFCNFGGIHDYIGKVGTPQRAYSAGRSQVTTPRMQQYITIRRRYPETLMASIDLVLSKEELIDAEIGYGRAEDIKSDYPYATRWAS
jgi:predicted amidohydrolase